MSIADSWRKSCLAVKVGATPAPPKVEALVDDPHPIARFRKKHGLSQVDLAIIWTRQRGWNVNRAQISNWECGRRKMSFISQKYWDEFVNYYEITRAS